MKTLFNLLHGMVPLYRWMLNQVLESEEFPKVVIHANSILQVALVAIKLLTLKIDNRCVKGLTTTKRKIAVR